MINKSKVKKILVISLSNIGDVVLTFPVIDILKNDFPEAELSVVVGPKAEALLKNNFLVKNVYVYDKHQPFIKTVLWLLRLRKPGFDLIVDLRNTAIPFFLGARYSTSPFMKRLKGEHMLRQHLSRLKDIYPYLKRSDTRYSLKISQEDKEHIDNILDNKLGQNDRFIAVAAGAADSLKRWTEDGFAYTCDELMDKYSVNVVFVGDAEDRNITQKIIKKMHNAPLNLCGRSSLTQLAYLLKRSLLCLTNDSAPMHIASYFNIPVVALFGPTAPSKYGPWSDEHAVVEKKSSCPKCSTDKKSDVHVCMESLEPSEVLEAVEEILKGKISKKDA